MTNPPSHIRVSVEETENGYIVQAGSAVARISRTILGYAVDADSQVLKEEYNLSPGVEKVRKSAHTAVQFSADPTDETRLILRTQRNFLLLSQAVEMVCGFIPKDFPRESDWKLFSSWKNERDVVVEPEHAVASQIGETTTPAGVSSGEVQGEFGTTLQDIVSEVEDEVDAEYQSNSWRVIPNKSAEKFLDKSAFEFHETGVPKDVCDFFGATNLPAGSRKPINLINNSKRLTGYIIKDMTKSGRVKLRWDDDVSDIISRYRKKDDDKLSLVFFKMLDLDTYNIIVRKVVGAKTGENNTIPSVVEEPRSKAEFDVLPSQNIGEEYSPDVLRIHEAVSKLPRYRFDDSTEINVKNGLLVVFEDGEKYGEYDRIVYVGINKTSGRLPGRVHDLVAGNKDGVVLRKYIGESLLRKDGHSYARIWAKDSSSPEGRRKIGTFYDPQKQEETEARVTSYLKKQMSFSAIEIPNSTRRSLLQSELVSTLQEAYSQSSVSSTWLGRYHSDPKIRSGALWMIGNANSRSFNKEEVETFLKEIQNSQSGKTQRNSAPAPLPEVVVEYKKPITENKIPVTKDIVPQMNEEPTLYDVLQMEDTSKRERILLKVVKHHLKALGVENIQTFALAPLIINQTVSKSTLQLSYGIGKYSKPQIENTIQQLISNSTITAQVRRNFTGIHATYYKLRDIDRFILELNLRKDTEIRMLTRTLENVTHSLNVGYPITNNDYINQNSPTYTKIIENLINPITSLGITQEVAKLLVYIHLFKNVAENDMHLFLQQTFSKGKDGTIIRDLCHINWITTSEIQRKNGIIYSLTNPLADILLDYVLSHAESLEKSVIELKEIIAYVKNHPSVISEVYGLPLEEEEDVVVHETLSEYVDEKLLAKQNQLEKSITSKLVKYGYDHASSLVFLDLLLKRPVCEGALAPILQMQDEMSKEVIESLIRTHNLITSIQKDREGKSEKIYKMRYSPKNFVEKLLKHLEDDVVAAEDSIEKIRDTEKKFVDSSIEGWIKPQYLPEFAELVALFCSLGLENNVAETLVLLSVKPNTSIQNIVDELALEMQDVNYIEETLSKKGFITKQKTGDTDNYHLTQSLTNIIQAHTIQIRKNYDSEVRDFITLVNYLISVDGEINAKYQQALEGRKEVLSRHKMLLRVFFTPFSHPLNSYMEIIEQVYDLHMKKGFSDVRVCLVELLPSEDGEVLHASPLVQSELFQDTELLLYGYYKEYNQYVVWDFSPSYEVLKMRDLTVPKDIFDPVAGQDKVLLRTLPSGANVITCPVNKPYQAIKYWSEKKLEKEEEDSWFK